MRERTLNKEPIFELIDYLVGDDIYMRDVGGLITGSLEIENPDKVLKKYASREGLICSRKILMALSDGIIVCVDSDVRTKAKEAGIQYEGLLAVARRKTEPEVRQLLEKIATYAGSVMRPEMPAYAGFVRRLRTIASR